MSETKHCMLEYFLSPAKADLLPTDGGSSAHSGSPGYGPESTTLDDPEGPLRTVFQIHAFSEPTTKI